MGRIIAVNSNCYHGYSIEQAIDGIAAAGFRYIELTATKGWTEHVFPRPELRAAVAGEGAAGRKGPHPLLHERPL